MTEPTLLAAMGAGLISLGILNIIGFILVMRMNKALQYTRSVLGVCRRLHAELSEDHKRARRNSAKTPKQGFDRRRFIDKNKEL